MIKLVAFDLDDTIGDALPMCIQDFKKLLLNMSLREVLKEISSQKL